MVTDNASCALTAATMLLISRPCFIHGLLFSILGLLIAGARCDDDLGNQSRPLRPRAATKKLLGLERTITIVTDAQQIDGLPGQYGSLYPAHSWVIFGATDEDRPLRVELVSPIIDGVPNGLAISVIELASDREDVGEVDFPLPKDTTRYTDHVQQTTKLRNAEIFNPFAEPGSEATMADGLLHTVLDAEKMAAEALPHPVLALALKVSPSVMHGSMRSSHHFVQALVCRGEFSVPLRDMWWSANSVPRRLAMDWSLQKRQDAIGPDLSRSFSRWLWPTSHRDRDWLRVNQIMGINNPITHIFYEAAQSQPRLRGARRNPSVTSLFEIYAVPQSGETVYRAARILNPWKSLLKASPPSTFKLRQSTVTLSRDPRLTSGYLLPTEFGQLPLILQPTSAKSPSSLWWQSLLCGAGPDATLSKRSSQRQATSPWCTRP